MVKQNKETNLDGFCRSGECQLMPAVYAVLPNQLHHCSLRSVDTHMGTAAERTHQLQDSVGTLPCFHKDNCAFTGLKTSVANTDCKFLPVTA